VDRRANVRPSDAPRMIRIVPIEKGNHRAGIGEGHKRPGGCFSASPWAKRRPQFSESASVVPFTVPT
jgi:hypothetical protein